MISNSYDRNIVRLKIISPTRSADEIEALLKIKGDKKWKAGDFRAGTIILEKDNGWVVNSGAIESESLSSQLLSLLRRIDKCKEELRKISETDLVEFSCVVYAERVPALYFEKEIVRQIALAGASLDVDLYIVGE